MWQSCAQSQDKMCPPRTVPLCGSGRAPPLWGTMGYKDQSPLDHNACRGLGSELHVDRSLSVCPSETLTVEAGGSMGREG